MGAMMGVALHLTAVVVVVDVVGALELQLARVSLFLVFCCRLELDHVQLLQFDCGSYGLLDCTLKGCKDPTD